MTVTVTPQEIRSLNRADRIIQLLDHLGIQRTHVAADLTPDWEELTAKYPDRIASLSLIFPQPSALPRLQGLAERLFVIYGDQPPEGEPIAMAVANLPGARHVTLKGSSNLSWDDTLPHYVETVAPPLLAFLDSHQTGVAPLEHKIAEAVSGDVAGISYELQGCGQPLVMLPLGLAPTQWDSLLPALQQRYSTLVLNGPELGIMPLLEARGRSRAYRRLMRNMFHELHPRPGETILDVGCGSGVMEIWLAEHIGGQNPITALDINPYFLREAAAQIRKAGFESIVEFREGNAVSLPFDDNQFDIVFSTTVMEEVDANKMLSEPFE